MVIERAPFTVRCRQCGEVYRLDFRDESTWACLRCHARDYRLNTGREFRIESIEVEGFAEGEEDTTAASLAARQARMRARRVPAGSLAVSGKRPAVKGAA